MTTEALEIVGYFSFDCQPDGYCTYGCGKRPHTICAECYDHAMWLEPDTVPTNLHPMVGSEDDTFTDVCDLCDEYF
jgi:hypothetical protein